MNFDRMKGWPAFAVGVAMIAIGAAGLKTVDAAEAMVPLSVDDLRQVEGQFSPLVAQGGQVAGQGRPRP